MYCSQRKTKHKKTKANKSFPQIPTTVRLIVSSHGVKRITNKKAQCISCGCDIVTSSCTGVQTHFMSSVKTIMTLMIICTDCTFMKVMLQFLYGDRA